MIIFHIAFTNHTAATTLLICSASYKFTADEKDIMDSNMLFEIAKYIEAPAGSGMQAVLESRECAVRNRLHVGECLNRRLLRRPSRAELMSCNILREDALRFDKMHEALSQMEFRTENRSRVASGIAGQVKKLDFYLRRKMMIAKLGIEDLENIYRSKSFN